MKTVLNLLKLSFLTLLLSLQVLAVKAQYCSVSWTLGGVEPITLVDFGGINNATANTGSVGLEDFTLQTASTLQGVSYPISVQCNTFGNYTNYVRVYIDWDQDSDFTDPGESYDIGTITNSTGLDGIQATGNILIPFTATLGSTRMRVVAKYAGYGTSCNTSGYGQAEDYTVNVLAGNSCLGTPVAGTATGPSAICPNTSFNLGLTGYTAASGITIQWEYDDGSGWQNITGASNPTYAITGITVPTSYRATVTCINGGSQDQSNTIAVSVNTPTQCYCTIGYPLSGRGPISMVNLGSISNTTSAAVNQPEYEDFTSMSTTLMQGQTEAITVKGNTVGNYSDTIKVFIDWDQNGLFTDAGEELYIGKLTNSTGTDAVEVINNITVPGNALTGTTRMRVTKKYVDLTYSGPCNTTGYGQAEDYTLNILLANSCTGTPTAGTAAAPVNVCPNTSFNLNLTGNTVAAGVTLQWQFYNTSTSSWEDITGASTGSYNIASGITASTDYRAVVTCTNGGSQDISNVITVGITPFLNCYCTATNSGGTAITNISIAGTTLNNASGAAPSPNYYIAYPATGSTTATLMEGVNYTLNASFGAAAIASVWIDYNQDGIYDAAEWTQITTNASNAFVTLAVPAGTPSGLTGMRIRSRGTGYTNDAGNACGALTTGETEDYLITIAPAVNCSGTPASGVATAPSVICPATSFNLELNGFTVAACISVQWEYDDGSGWQTLAGAGSATYTVTGGISTPASYRAVVTCTNTGQQSISNVVSVSVNAPSVCYCAVSFPSGDVEPITLVDFAGINNATSNTIAGTPQYEDFTGITGTVAQGQSYAITVQGNTNGSYTDNIRVFIDLDQNGMLTDPGESFDLGTIANSTGLDAVMATGNILIPLGTPVGSTRMRVTKKWNGYATACNTSGYGQAEDYTLIVGYPLAIRLKDITAVNAGSRNRVDWSTADEMKGDHFELERSADGIRFTKLAAIGAKGVASDYRFWDEFPASGANYYRLKMIDATGSIEYSRMVEAGVKDLHAFGISAYPNPAGDEIVVSLHGTAGYHPVLVITDITGKVVRQISVTTNTVPVSMNGMTPGVYFLRYTDDRHSQTIKINKQ